MHNGRVSGDGPSHDIVGIRKVNNDDLGLLADFLLDADEVVRLECQRLPKRIRVCC